MTEPAPTLTSKSKDQWVIGPRTLMHRRDSEAWKAEHGERENRTEVEPAPTISGEAWRWSFDRPATTIVGSFCPDVVAAPGYRVTGSRQNAEGSIKITESEALVLQGMRADYPVAGSRTKRFEQIGNLVPAPLAAAVVKALL